MRLTRSAFAVMVKVQGLSGDLMSLVDEVEMNWEEKGKDKAAMVTYLKEQNGATIIFKRWESASKMRIFISEKKKDLMDVHKKQVEADFLKKKRDTPQKEEDKMMMSTESKEEKKPESVELTEGDREEIENIAFALVESELKETFAGVVEKASFLIQLQIPTAYQVSKDDGQLIVISD